MAQWWEHWPPTNVVRVRFRPGTIIFMWVEFVVGSRPCSKGFSPGSPVFLPPQKPTLLNSNSIGIRGPQVCQSKTVTCNPRKTKLICFRILPVKADDRTFMPVIARWRLVINITIFLELLCIPSPSLPPAKSPCTTGPQCVQKDHSNKGTCGSRKCPYSPTKEIGNSWGSVAMGGSQRPKL